MNGRTTIADVAQRAGVTRSTVSHAMSGKRPVSEELRGRVFAAIDKLGYKPSFAARTLRGERTRVIAGLFDNAILGGALPIQLFSDGLRKHGYIFSAWFCETGEDASRAMKSLGTGMADAVINAIPKISVQEAAMACHPLPTVTFLRNYEGAPVALDEKTPYYETFDYLWRLGHRRIGMFYDERTAALDESNPRPEAYRAFMEAHGAYDPDLIREIHAVTCATGVELGKTMATFFHAKGCSAIVCNSDMEALGVLAWAQSQGLRVPEDLSVMGEDDIPFARLATPPLTSLQAPLEEIVEATISALLAKLEPAPRTVRPKPFPRYKLIVRDSTGPAKQTAS